MIDAPDVQNGAEALILLQNVDIVLVESLPPLETRDQFYGLLEKE